MRWAFSTFAIITAILTLVVATSKGKGSQSIFRSKGKGKGSQCFFNSNEVAVDGILIGCIDSCTGHVYFISQEDECEEGEVEVEISTLSGTGAPTLAPTDAPTPPENITTTAATTTQDPGPISASTSSATSAAEPSTPVTPSSGTTATAVASTTPMIVSVGPDTVWCKPVCITSLTCPQASRSCFLGPTPTAHDSTAKT